jgi:uncharacterized protein (DUF1015 family)
MPDIRPIPALVFAEAPDVTNVIAPPYDVLDADAKAALVAQSPHNIVVIDLPHLPAKTVGPDEAYEAAGRTFRAWRRDGVLVPRPRPTMFVYQQTFTVAGRTFKRRGLIANLRVQPMGVNADGRGAIRPHEETFSAAKEDRLKLMIATRAQLSPIFGFYAVGGDRVAALMAKVIESGTPADLIGRTAGDNVLHEAWTVGDHEHIRTFTNALTGIDVFIADGHHRYNTAINYRDQFVREQGPLPRAGAGDHPANFCMFVLVSIDDPGMIVLPTHRVVGGLSGLTMAKLAEAAAGLLRVEPFDGPDLAALERALPGAGALPGGHHAVGLYLPGDPGQRMAIATTLDPDPLAATHGERSEAWRRLDVAIVQHLILERVFQEGLAGSVGPQGVSWKFPHDLADLKTMTDSGAFQLGLVLQPTPLESVRKVSEASELMPQKSTFFYPKLATGLVLNPLERDAED